MRKWWGGAFVPKGRRKSSSEVYRPLLAVFGVISRIGTTAGLSPSLKNSDEFRRYLTHDGGGHAFELRERRRGRKTKSAGRRTFGAPARGFAIYDATLKATASGMRRPVVASFVNRNFMQSPWVSRGIPCTFHAGLAKIGTEKIW